MGMVGNAYRPSQEASINPKRNPGLRLRKHSIGSGGFSFAWQKISTIRVRWRRLLQGLCGLLTRRAGGGATLLLYPWNMPFSFKCSLETVPHELNIPTPSYSLISTTHETLESALQSGQNIAPRLSGG